MRRFLIVITIAVAVGSMALSALSLLALTGHADLAAHALAVMALDRPPVRSGQGQRTPRVTVIAAEEAEAPARFESGKVELGPGLEMMVVTDRAARCMTNIVLQKGKVVGVGMDCVPAPAEEDDDEDLEDSGIREVKG